TFAESRPSDLLTHLQAAAAESPNQGFRVNEVRFVAHDGAGEPVTMAGALAANTISSMGPEITDWLKDPKKLLQLISAAEGTHGGPNNTPELEVTPAYDQQAVPLYEDDVLNVIRFMSRMGAVKQGGDGLPNLASVQQELTQLDPNSHSLLYQTLFTQAA